MAKKNYDRESVLRFLKKNAQGLSFNGGLISAKRDVQIGLGAAGRIDYLIKQHHYKFVRSY